MKKYRVVALQDYDGPAGKWSAGQEGLASPEVAKFMAGKPQHFKIGDEVTVTDVDLAPPKKFDAKIIDMTVDAKPAVPAAEKRRVRYEGDGPVDYQGHILERMDEIIVEKGEAERLADGDWGFILTRGKIKPVEDAQGVVEPA